MWGEKKVNTISISIMIHNQPNKQHFSSKIERGCPKLIKL